MPSPTSLSAAASARRCLPIRRAAIAVVGGGPAGYFGAIESARELSRRLRLPRKNPRRRSSRDGDGIAPPPPRVVLLESSSRPLRKVLLSGGGRCNVMHRILPRPVDLSEYYPRGGKAMVGPFSAFTQEMTREWFGAEGVRLKAEDDGRVFPDTDDAATVASALEGAARRAGVEVWTGAKVRGIAALVADAALGEDEDAEEGESESAGGTPADGPHAIPRPGGSFELSVDLRKSSSRSVLRCDAVLLATGSAPAGYRLAANLGQPLEPPCPSLFSFRLKGGHALEGLQGVSLPDVELSLLSTDPSPLDPSTEGRSNSSRKRKRRSEADGGFVQCGPLLVTHRGVSGPAALRLSAFAARALKLANYEGVLSLNLVPDAAGGEADADVAAVLRSFRNIHGRRKMSSSPGGFYEGGETGLEIPRLPRRVWRAILRHCHVDPEMRWARLSDADAASLGGALTALPLPFRGKDSNKEEFVTAGGVKLEGVDLRRMESKVVPGLFFAGEVLDVDGVTGGFNFQSCWTGGHVAGVAMAESVSVFGREGA